MVKPAGRLLAQRGDVLIVVGVGNRLCEWRPRIRRRRRGRSETSNIE